MTLLLFLKKWKWKFILGWAFLRVKKTTAYICNIILKCSKVNWNLKTLKTSRLNTSFWGLVSILFLTLAPKYICMFFLNGVKSFHISKRCTAYLSKILNVVVFWEFPFVLIIWAVMHLAYIFLPWFICKSLNRPLYFPSG